MVAQVINALHRSRAPASTLPRAAARHGAAAVVRSGRGRWVRPQHAPTPPQHARQGPLWQGAPRRSSGAARSVARLPSTRAHAPRPRHAPTGPQRRDEGQTRSCVTRPRATPQ